MCFTPTAVFINLFVKRMSYFELYRNLIQTKTLFLADAPPVIFEGMKVYKFDPTALR